MSHTPEPWKFAIKPRITVGKYRLTNAAGKHIRWATWVKIADWKEIKFLDYLPKHQAINQAIQLWPRLPGYHP